MRRVAVVGALTVSLLALVPPVQSGAWTTFTFYGSGFGHGLGMSQYGAYGLALRGWSHQRILQLYYRGAIVGRAASGPSSLRIGLLNGVKTIHVEAAHGWVGIRAGSPTTGSLVGGRAIAPGATWTVQAWSSGLFRVLDEHGRLASGRLWGGSGQCLFVTYRSSGARAHVREAGHTYARGYLELNAYTGDGCSSGSCERAIAVLSPQDYLAGLGEVPSSWPMQALEAQAVAARTYGFEKVARLGQHRPGCNCGLYASTWDQTYVGWDKEAGSFAGRWLAAVARTNREVIRYHGALIQAYYTSSSGGYTESNQNAWGGSPIAYLRGTCDPGDYTAANPNRTWKVGPLSTAVVTARLRPYTGWIGTVVGFADIARGVSGRIVRLTVRGTGGTATLSGSAFSWAIGLRDDRVWINANRNVMGRIRLKYDALMCAPGLPLGPQRSVPGGVRQLFANGAIYWNRARSRAFWLHGPMFDYYLRAGGVWGHLGLPASDVGRASNGVTSATFSDGTVVSCLRVRSCYAHGRADLSISVRGPARARAGDIVTYVIAVRNHGPSPTVATVKDALAGLGTLVSAVPSSGRCGQSEPVVCSLGRLSRGAAATVKVRILLRAAGVLVQRPTVSGPDHDPRPADDATSIRTTVGMPDAIMTGPTAAFQPRIGIPVSWATRGGNGVSLRFDVRVRSARWNGRLGAPALWRAATVATADVYRGLPGSTHCFSVRLRDTAGHVSAWSREACSSLPLDDRRLIRAGGWTRHAGGVSYRATSSESDSAGARLMMSGVTDRRMALLVQTCPGCGRIGVYWNGRLLTKISLDVKAGRIRQIVAVIALPTSGPGTLVVKVLGSGKPVVIDGVGLSVV